MKLRVSCPAKVNLFLAVGPRDGRGYHPIRTIFQAVGLFDILEVTFGTAKTPTLEVVGAELPQENTVSKALRLSREVFDLSIEHVRLEKHIPVQSGLGGGSSDAAGVLRALNRVRPVPLTELESVAMAIGADVPFFLTGGRASGEGYGDRITPLPDAPDEWFVIAKPDIGCSTVEMYAKLDAQAREWKDWPEDDRLCNDFESVAPGECLELIDKLRSLGADQAGLSGSGSSVFGVFRTQSEAMMAVGPLQAVGHAWLAKSLNRSESLRIEDV